MASTKSGLTPAQKRELERLHQSPRGIVVQHYRIQLMQVYGGLQAKGLVDNQMYVDQTTFTLTDAGKQLARELFGSPSTPETVASDPDVASEQGSALADLQHAVNDYRDMLSRCDDIAECDRLLELIAECDKQIAKLQPAPVADADLPFASGLDDGEPAYEVTHIAGLDGGYIVVDSDGQNLTQPTRIRGIADVLARKANDSEPVSSEPACDWCKSTVAVSMRYYRGHAVMQVCEDCMPSQDTVDPMPATALTDDLLAESRAGWGERTETLMADTRKVTGHGRTSRNRTKTARRREFSKPMAKVTLANMQRRQQPLERKSRPVKPAIQIAEVLRQMGVLQEAA